MATVLDGLNKLSLVIAPFFYKLLFMSIAALCIGIVIMLIRRFADNRISPAWKYTMWLVVLVALAVPYRPQTEFALLEPMAKVQEISYRSEYEGIRKNQHDFVDIEPSAPEQQTELIKLQEEVQAVFLKSLTFDVAIPLIWLSGAVVTALFMLISRMRLIHKLKQHQHETNTRHIALLQNCKAVLRVRGNVRLVTQDYIGSPALLGFVRPRIILPLYANEISDSDMEYILLHELSHYKRFDMLLNNLLLLLQAVYWFNPLIWIMFRFIRQDMELANDASVIKRIGNENSKDYLRSLVEVLRRYNNVTFAPKLLCMVDDKDSMARRIKMIKLGALFKKRRLLIAALSIAIICTVSILFLTQSPSSHATMKWAKNLSVSEVERIELVVMPGVENERYRLFKEDEFEDVIALINQSRGSHLTNPEELNGGAVTFYVTTKDGLRHTVTNIGNTQLFIDTDYYDAGYDWLSSWQYTRGNAPLPEDFSFEGNGKGGKLQSFKGLELYVWKNEKLTGSGEPYFTLLEGTNRNKEHAEIYNLDAAVFDIKAVGQALSRYDEGLHLSLYQMNETDFTKEQMSGFLDALMEYMPQNSSASIGLFELPLSSAAQEEQQLLTFWVKPDEPAQGIGKVAAMQWLNSYMGEKVPGAQRISGYTIDRVTVLGYERSESDSEIEDYSIHVRIQYGITAATADYSSPEDGISGKGTFDGLFREMYVKMLGDGNFAVVSVYPGKTAVLKAELEVFNKLGVFIHLPENENWIGSPTYRVIDETIAHVEYYDKFVKTDMVLRAGREDIRTLSGISYSFDVGREEHWSAGTFEDGSPIDIKVQCIISDKEMKGVLASWSYKGFNYALWGSISDKEVDISPIAKTAVYIANHMR